MMGLLYSLVMLGMKLNFDIWLQHIPRVDNAVADAVSRFRNEFQELASDADVKMMPPSTFRCM